MFSWSELVSCSACLACFFFKQKTAYEMRISDWSSDVCFRSKFHEFHVFLLVEVVSLHTRSNVESSAHTENMHPSFLDHRGNQYSCVAVACLKTTQRLHEDCAGLG